MQPPFSPSPSPNVHRFGNVDLHCHSTVSDGTLSPATLAERAHANGVTLWALTDHDTIAGQAEAAYTAQTLGLAYVTGLEVSVSFLNKTVHIVGLDFDPQDPKLQAGLLQTCGGRLQRAQAMAQALMQMGLPDTLAGALRYASNPEMVSRSHFARYLVEIGVCKDRTEVFRKYLGDGKQGCVPHCWASLADALQWIQDAGGVAIIAHPARYRFTLVEEAHFFSEFRRLGGVGMEVVTGSHSAQEAQRYAQVAFKEGFAASRGSDFHCPSEYCTDLGRLAPLPDHLVPIWQHFPRLYKY